MDFRNTTTTTTTTTNNNNTNNGRWRIRAVLPACLVFFFFLSLRVDGFGYKHHSGLARPTATTAAVATPTKARTGPGSRFSGGVVLFDTTGTTETETERISYPFQKTDDEWKEILTPDQYYVLRREGTETPGASPLNQISPEKNGAADAGTFCCAGCGNPLFLASSKYDSGTGWPSFWAPVSASAVALKTDYKLIVPRSECVCSKCGGHLGHVFEDGPDPTGQRYCMNGAAMQFYRDSERPELAEEVSKMAEEDPFKLSPAQALPSVAINLFIGGIFFNAFLTSGKATPIEFLTLLPATYYGFLAAKSIAKMTA